MGNKGGKQQDKRDKVVSGEGGGNVRTKLKGWRIKVRGGNKGNLGKEDIGREAAKKGFRKEGGSVTTELNGYREGEVPDENTELVIKSVVSVVNVKGRNRNVSESEKEGVTGKGEELIVKDGGLGRCLESGRERKGVTASGAILGQRDEERVNLKTEETERGSRELTRRHGRGDTVLEGAADAGLGVGEAKVGQRDDKGRIITADSGEKGEVSHLTQQDYLQLLKLLSVRLPEGVLTPEVISLANMESSIQDAQAIILELEQFHIRFKVIPRLGCREVKNCLAKKRQGNVLQITKLLFFDQEEDEALRRKHWSKNKTNTGRGFRLKDRYMGDTAVSTPAMYATAATRSWAKLEVGEESPIVTKGTKVNVRDLERTEYCDESELWTDQRSPGPQRFGMFSQNKADELEMLKFFHELGSSGTRTASYTQGNKVGFGFLSGRLDFLAQIQTDHLGKKLNAGDENKHECFIIECKSTTGNMAGKLFTKIPNSQQAVINRTHEYTYQVQTYMYILKSQKEFQMTKAVMIVRHYHQGGVPPRDFYWSHLEMDSSIQFEIEELRIFCQTEVLARYLALLNLIFLKETKLQKQGFQNDL